MIVWFLVDRNITKVDGPSSMNLSKPRMLKLNNVSQRKTKSKYLKKINTAYLVPCGDRKEIECRTWTGSTKFMMPLAEDARSQLGVDPQWFCALYFNVVFRYFNVAFLKGKSSLISTSASIRSYLESGLIWFNLLAQELLAFLQKWRKRPSDISVIFIYLCFCFFRL